MRKEKNSLMIAGGIGITPMRAIIKDLEYKDIEGEITLFYIDSKNEYVFRDELEKTKGENSKINTIFITNRKDLEDLILEYIERHKNDSLYLISGNPRMVKETRNKLKYNGIKNKNIINDSFRGYK